MNESCKCWGNMEEGLKAKGFQIDSQLCQLVMSEEMVPFVRHVLPLRKLDGKKPKRSEPGCIIMSHCPFCGQAYAKHEPLEVKRDEHCTAGEGARAPIEGGAA